MGSFDTVNFYCPACGSSIHVQSKADECKMKEYDRSEVPSRIAVDLYGEKITCSYCKSLLEVSNNIGKFVPMYLNVITFGDYDE